MTDPESIDCSEMRQFLHRVHRGPSHWSKRLLVWLGLVSDQVCQRRIRLFACACARRLPFVTRDPPSAAAIALCEKYADGLVGKQAVTAARTAFSVDSDVFHPVRCIIRCLLSAEGEQGWLTVASLANLLLAKTKVGSKHYFVGDPTYSARLSQARQAEMAIQQELLRDIFVRPRNSVTFLPNWRTATVRQLARTVYYEHVPYLMPLLGKALRDAGCGNEIILQHCLGKGPHVCGCWVVDLVLDKE